MSTIHLLSSFAGPEIGPFALCGAVYDLTASRRDAFGDCGASKQDPKPNVAKLRKGGTKRQPFVNSYTPASFARLHLVLVQILIGNIVLRDLMRVHFPGILIVGSLHSRYRAGLSDVSFFD